jgi:hypothetical protein
MQTTHNCCRENLPFLWERRIPENEPRSSPDCDIFDYFIFGVFERYINKSTHNIKQSLINSIKEAFSKFTRGEVKRTSCCFRLRLEEAVAAEYDFIR